MADDAIALRYAGNRRFARLRELTGRDERSVAGTDTASAIQLLDRLAEFPATAGGGAFAAADLTAADRDMLLAQIYRRAFSDRISNTLTCTRCAKPFDLHFSLEELGASLHSATRESRWTHTGDRQFEAPGVGRFRLPQGRDELEAAGLDAGAAEALLLERCTGGSELPGGANALQEILEDAAPLLDLDLTATCPECGQVSMVQFDVQGYLLSALLAERRRLTGEIHLIASHYGWSLDEVLSLSRSERREFVEAIENNQPSRSSWSR